MIFPFFVRADWQPSGLVIKAETFARLQKEYKQYPLMETAVSKMKARVDAALEEDIDVPVPKDPAGGYTHEQHKRNYIAMYEAGIIYQITGENLYAEYVKEMLMTYAQMFPTLGLHPVEKSYAPGKLFWQCLNDDNWVVFSIQAYSFIQDFLTKEDRQWMEQQLWRPYAKFLMDENLKVFNRVHNHGLWDVAAVGMIGYALGDEALVKYSLFGKFEELEEDPEKAAAGFYANVNELFSPTGYYTEGPYYHRYAITPFLVFAQVIHNNEPERNIFQYRDGLLLKAVKALVQLSDDEGRFLPYNDAIKEMSIKAPAAVEAVDLAYEHEQSVHLLAAANLQGEVKISLGGLIIAQELAEGASHRTAVKKSAVLTDGPAGDKGGIAFLYPEQSENNGLLTLKFTQHGLSHGHFDKLSLLFRYQGHDILQDYGAVRFVNVKAKEGGRYLPENKNFAHQSACHNTLIVDGKSHFNGDFRLSSQKFGELLQFDTAHQDYQVVTARQQDLYQGVDMYRTIIQIEDEKLNDPLYIDIVKAESEEVHEYQLAYQYKGQIMSKQLETYEAAKSWKAMGANHGFQYIWEVGKGHAVSQDSRLTFLNGSKFFSLRTHVDQPTEITLGRYGANDPENNLRTEPAYFLKKSGQDIWFVSTIEPHGFIRSATDELVADTESQILKISREVQENDIQLIELHHDNGNIYQVLVASDFSLADHRSKLNGREVEWEGPIYVNIYSSGI
ncbi:hypothetical protein PEDI_46670 [Persicobacter diffluens]|uniref:Alginate lyase domain-containing protein n=1 Tax=Persicobacter diffluens TaxID=981 RepID=A0AAN4W4U4_9BACT|nr:hypothetical protein PEDI_46670 [Persicobacter diffluens]